MDPKQLAAESALTYIRSGMVVGLGTGSTARLFIAALGTALQSGRLKDIRGIPTSKRSDEQGRSLGIPIITHAQSPMADVTVDGADEVDPRLDLVKGLGGALLREKIVAQNSRKLVIVADASKKVAYLGMHAPLPVEVAQFGFESHVPFLRSLGAEPVLRKGEGDRPYVTDNGNFIYDCRFARIEDPRGLETKLKSRAGLVETGLFVGMASVVLIATDKDVETLVRK
jgi:ribose 5-phosphate isomerase A